MRRRAAIGTIIGAATLWPPRRALAADVPLRMALLPVDADAVLYYGSDLGYFREVSIEPEIQSIQAGSSVVAAIVGGSLDVGWTTPISLAAAHQHGVPLVAVAPCGIYELHAPTAAIMVPKDSPIKSARDFSGKRMACSGLRELGQWAPAAWIDKNGGDSRQVEFVEIPFADMPLALAQHRIDAAFPAEPFVTLAKDSSRIFADAYAAIAPRFGIGVWVTTAQWADAHRELVVKFIDVVAESAMWANAHRDQSAIILAKYGKLDPALVRRMARVRYAPRLLASDLQPLIDLGAHYGALPSAVAASELIYKV
jgi:ABC-type nitrate/sulfonate/bicarbonate transport system substrate-binding protein